MAQKLGFYGLSKKLSIDKLNSKVGGVYLNPSKSGGKILSGIQRGTNLKKFLINAAKGKTAYTVNKELQLKYCISGSQAKKRKEIMDLIGDNKMRTKLNLKRAQQERIEEEEREGENDNRSSISILGRVGDGVHGEASRLGIGAKQIHSQISILSPNINKPSDNASPKIPLDGIRPLGFK